MALRHLISLSLLLPALWQTAHAQSAADDYFHGGALFYLSNNIPGALEKVESGLKVYPDDLKLKKLEELLKKQNQQQQQNQNQDQQQNDQSKGSGEQKDSKAQQQKEPDKSESKNPDQKPDQQKPGPQPKEQPSDQPEKANADYREGEMTPQQARQLLDAQKNDETLLPMKPDEKAAARRGRMRDW